MIYHAKQINQSSGIGQKDILRTYIPYLIRDILFCAMGIPKEMPPLV